MGHCIMTNELCVTSGLACFLLGHFRELLVSFSVEEDFLPLAFKTTSLSP